MSFHSRIFHIFPAFWFFSPLTLSTGPKWAIDNFLLCVSARALARVSFQFDVCPLWNRFIEGFFYLLRSSFFFCRYGRRWKSEKRWSSARHFLCVFLHKWKRNRPLHSSLRNAALRWRFNLPPSWQMHSCRVSSFPSAQVFFLLHWWKMYNTHTFPALFFNPSVLHPFFCLPLKSLVANQSRMAVKLEHFLPFLLVRWVGFISFFGSTTWIVHSARSVGYRSPSPSWTDFWLWFKHRLE